MEDARECRKDDGYNASDLRGHERDDRVTGRNDYCDYERPLCFCHWEK
jgi:hypothetical protein